jgi:YHS domain-containing protein
MLLLIDRLFLLLFVISAIRLVVRSVRNMRMGAKGTQARPRVSYAAPGAGATMLQQDPVCGTYVAIDSSLKRIVKGKVVHFCSAECRDKYAVDASVTR